MNELSKMATRECASRLPARAVRDGASATPSPLPPFPAAPPCCVVIDKSIAAKYVVTDPCTDVVPHLF